MWSISNVWNVINANNYLITCLRVEQKRTGTGNESVTSVPGSTFAPAALASHWVQPFKDKNKFFSILGNLKITQQHSYSLVFWERGTKYTYFLPHKKGSDLKFYISFPVVCRFWSFSLYLRHISAWPRLKLLKHYFSHLSFNFLTT